MGCFVWGVKKWHGMFCPGMFCPAPHLEQCVKHLRLCVQVCEGVLGEGRGGGGLLLSFVVIQVYINSPDHYSYSQISVICTLIIRNYWVIRRLRTVPTFFFIIFCNKTPYYSNFDYPKNSIFRSDSSLPITEIAIKLPFKIRSPNVTHGDHDVLVWSSSIYTSE